MIAEQTTPPSNFELDRTEIAIHVQDGTNRRLIEGLAIQLNLTPVVVDDMIDPRD